MVIFFIFFSFPVFPKYIKVLRSTRRPLNCPVVPFSQHFQNIYLFHFVIQLFWKVPLQFYNRFVFLLMSAFFPFCLLTIFRKLGNRQFDNSKLLLYAIKNCSLFIQTFSSSYFGLSTLLPPFCEKFILVLSNSFDLSKCKSASCLPTLPS